MDKKRLCPDSLIYPATLPMVFSWAMFFVIKMSRTVVRSLEVLGSFLKFLPTAFVLGRKLPSRVRAIIKRS